MESARLRQDARASTPNCPPLPPTPLVTRDNNRLALALEPTDIEDIGVGLLEVIRPLTDQLHHKLDLAPDEPLVQLLLADYVENYGPEIWRLAIPRPPAKYRQRLLENAHSCAPPTTSSIRPKKVEPRTLVEVRYPLATAPAHAPGVAR